jgi:isopenicillin N synthase-like dioxygenase
MTNRTAAANRMLPIIDLAAARSNDPIAKRELARQFDHAFSTSGFCYVVNYGLPPSVIDDAFAASASFFHSPLEDKLKVSPSVDTMFRGYISETRKYRAYYDFNRDGPVPESTGQSIGGKQNFIFAVESPKSQHGTAPNGWPCGANPWPAHLPEFRTKMYTFYTEMHKVGEDILRMIALALGIDENFFRDRYGEDQDTSLGVMAYYPSLTAEEVAAGKQSLLGHCDYSCITLLVQDLTGGLQVQERSTQEWIDATPMKGAIVVNVGDLLARWSNNRYVSTPHRVMNTGGRERFSMVLTHNPRADIMVDPRDLGIGDRDSRYPPVKAGEYMWDRMMETSATDEDIAEVKERAIA